MKKSYLCLLSFATSIVALTESINKNYLFSYMMLIISIIFLFLYDNVFYRNLRFNKGDIRSLIIQLPIMLLISCLLVDYWLASCWLSVNWIILHFWVRGKCCMASAVQHFLSWVGDLICQNGMPEMQKMSVWMSV